MFGDLTGELYVHVIVVAVCEHTIRCHELCLLVFLHRLCVELQRRHHRIRIRFLVGEAETAFGVVRIPTAISVEYLMSRSRISIHGCGSPLNFCPSYPTCTLWTVLYGWLMSMADDDGFISSSFSFSLGEKIRPMKLRIRTWRRRISKFKKENNLLWNF